MKLTENHDFDFATFYTLTAPCGICVEICSVGASITRIELPDRNGNSQNVVLSFADKKEYLQNSVYAGAILAPNAGRIRNAVLTMNNSSYPLSANDGLHNLHGGRNSASFCNWTLKNLLHTDQKAEVVLETVLPDGQDGYPGRRILEATYTLDTSGTLNISYTAVTDQTTYLNLSNHTYFNLSGDFTKNSLSQFLQIPAQSYIANDREHLPMKLCSVENTPFDFRKSISVAAQMSSFPENEQLRNAYGYNNGFCLSHDSSVPDATLYDAVSGRKLELYTDAPCLVFYSGGYLSDSPKIENQDSRAITPLAFAALALEAQDFPDAPGNILFSCNFLTPNEVMRRKISFHFSCI